MSLLNCHRRSAGVVYPRTATSPLSLRARWRVEQCSEVARTRGKSSATDWSQRHSWPAHSGWHRLDYVIQAAASRLGSHLIPQEFGMAYMINQKLISTPTRDWLLLVEALGCLAAASVAIRLLPFRKVATLASRRRFVNDVISADAHGQEASRIRWAVSAVASRVPWRTVCFQKGLAAQLLLRRRRLPALLHYGISNRNEGLSAHVWVTSSDLPVIGSEVAHEYTCVAVFPRSAAGLT